MSADGHPECPICGSAGSSKLYSAPAFDQVGEDFDLLRCPTCGVVRTDPGPPVLDLSRYYHSDYYGGAERKFVGPVEWLTYLHNLQRARALTRHLPAERSADSPPRVLDVGCGRGHLLRVLADRGWDCHGVERADFVGQGPANTTLHIGELKDLALPEASFDAAVIWHVLEHLGDPVATLRGRA